MTTHKALHQKSGLFCLVEIETTNETVIVAVPMTTEVRGQTRPNTVEWAKQAYLQNKTNSPIIRTQRRLSNMPVLLNERSENKRENKRD
jgi:hypothetical protein